MNKYQIGYVEANRLYNKMNKDTFQKMWDKSEKVILDKLVDSDIEYNEDDLISQTQEYIIESIMLNPSLIK